MFSLTPSKSELFVIPSGSVIYRIMSQILTEMTFLTH